MNLQPNLIAPLHFTYFYMILGGTNTPLPGYSCFGHDTLI